MFKETYGIIVIRKKKGEMFVRLKHIKGAEEIVQSSTYVIHEPKNYKGKFNTLFQNENPIHVEIGMGKGNFILSMARQYPYINFIGIEKYDSVLVKALAQLEVLKLDNVRFIRMDATYIEMVFEKEIDTIYLNFSDPWPKVRHEKRRLTSLNFLQKYDALFKGKKNIVMKTDNRHLFEYSVKSFTEYGYHIEEISLDLHNDTIENIETEYEIKFSSLGYPIYRIKVYK